MKCFNFKTNIIMLTIMILITKIESKSTEEIKEFLEKSYGKLRTKRESLESDIKLLEQAQNNIEFLKTKIKSDKAVLITEKKKLLGKVNSYLKIFHDNNVEFPKFKQKLSHFEKNQHYSDEKIQKLFKKIIPNLSEEDFFENKKDSVVYSYLMKNRTNTSGRLENLDKLTATKDNNDLRGNDQTNPSIPDANTNIDDTSKGPTSDTPQNIDASSDPNINNDSTSNSIANNQPNLPSSVLLEKKSSAHSIFDAVEEELPKDNSIPIHPEPMMKQKEKKNLSQSKQHNNKTISVDNNTLYKNFKLNSVNNLKNNTKKEEGLSIFDTSLDDDNNNEAIIQVNTTVTNKSNIENKINSFNKTFINNMTIKFNVTNLPEVNRLAEKNLNKNSLMIELKSNSSLNRTTIKKKHFKAFYNSTKNKTETVDKDKQERIAKFYKAYRERKKMLLKKLKEKNKPPLFNGEDLNKVKRLIKKDPNYIIKKYESPYLLSSNNAIIITNEDAGFGPIRIKRKAYEIDPNIPHYGYIGQQIFYNNIPKYNLRSYQGLDEIGRLN